MWTDIAIGTGSAQPRALLRILAEWWRRALARRRQRRALLRLDDHMLRDIGVTRAEARGEARRPFWR
jgi:uncharacterized protein YjiS (DUF1127 family)